MYKCNSIEIVFKTFSKLIIKANNLKNIVNILFELNKYPIDDFIFL